MKIVNKLVALFLSLHCITSVLDAEGASLIKRKVLILDFVSKNKADQMNSYLVETIPDAMIDPLSATKAFEIMKRDAGKKMVMLKQVKGDDLANEDVAIGVAKELGADVVVIGVYLVNNNEMLFQARAIEVESGRLAVSKSQRGAIGSNMFGLIDKLAKDLATEMKSELPPIPPGKEYITVGKAVTISVLDLEANGVEERVGKIGGDKLREALLETKLYKLVEQTQIRLALQKAGHAPSQMTDVTAAELGAKLDSEKVVLGRVSRVGDKFEMTARIVDVKTREVMVSATQKFSAENEMKGAAEKVALKFKAELESEKEDKAPKVDHRWAFDISLRGASSIADLSPALSLGGGVGLGARYSVWARGKFTIPLRGEASSLFFFGKSSYGNSLSFITAPMTLGTGVEYGPLFTPKLSAELFFSGGAAISYLKSNSLNTTYLSTDPAVMATLAFSYRLGHRFFARASGSYLWVLYQGSDLMSVGLNLGVGVNL